MTSTPRTNAALLFIGMALSASSAAAQVPNTFAPNTPIKSADVNANFSALASQKQNLVLVTQLVASVEVDDNAPTTAFKAMVDIGTFTKQQAASNIVITWNSVVYGNASGSYPVCGYLLVVDGVAATATDYGASISPSNSAYNNVSLTRLFAGLTAGTHTVSIWDRGIRASTCGIAPADLPQFAVVQEF